MNLVSLLNNKVFCKKCSTYAKLEEKKHYYFNSDEISCICPDTRYAETHPITNTNIPGLCISIRDNKYLAFSNYYSQMLHFLDPNMNIWFFIDPNCNVLEFEFLKSKYQINSFDTLDLIIKLNNLLERIYEQTIFI